MASEIGTAESRRNGGVEIVDGRTPVADRIRERIRKAGARFHVNHDISDHIEAGELDDLQREVELKMVEVLRALVIDTETDHNTIDTARRVAKIRRDAERALGPHRACRSTLDSQIAKELAAELGRSHGARAEPFPASRRPRRACARAPLGNALPEALAFEVAYLMRPGTAITGEVRHVDGGLGILA